MSVPLDVHPTAVVGTTARLGRGVTVGPYAVIEDDTDVGAGTEIRAHAVIRRYTRLGDGNAVHEGAARASPSTGRPAPAAKPSSAPGASSWRTPTSPTSV
jgi:acyl-[acyl carrier protein]--UDP-N-acetylglucosamine O-acyltransferase